MMYKQVIQFGIWMSKVADFIKPRLPGLLWSMGDLFTTAEGGVSHDPLFKYGAAVMTTGSVGNMVAGDKALKVFTGPCILLAGVMMATAGLVGHNGAKIVFDFHDKAKIAFGSGTDVATLAMFYGKDIASKLAEGRPFQKLLQTLSNVQSPIVGELIYGAINTSLVWESVKLATEWVKTHDIKTVEDMGLLLAAVASYTIANRVMSNMMGAGGATKEVAHSKLKQEHRPTGLLTAPNAWYE